MLNLFVNTNQIVTFRTEMFRVLKRIGSSLFRCTKAKGTLVQICFARIHAEWDQTAKPKGGQKHDPTQEPDEKSVPLVRTGDDRLSTNRTSA